MARASPPILREAGAGGKWGSPPIRLGICGHDIADGGAGVSWYAQDHKHHAETETAQCPNFAYSQHHIETCIVTPQGAQTPPTCLPAHPTALPERGIESRRPDAPAL